MRFVLVVLLVVSTPVLFADVIVQRTIAGEQTLRVDRIGTETYKEVKYLLGGSWQKMSAENIIEIRRERTTLGFQSAEQARAEGNYNEAIKKYDALLERELDDEDMWEKAYATYYKALCLQMLGGAEPAKLTEAMKVYKEFLNKFPEHRLVPHALQGRGTCALSRNLWADAEGAFSKLASREYGKYWEIIGKYWLGEVAYRQGDTSKAKQQWRLILGSADRYGMKDVRAKLTLLEGLEEMKKGNMDKAKKKFEKVIDMGASSNDVLAKAHNGLGDCYYREAGGDKAKLRKALFEYLKVVLLYSSVRKEYIHALEMAIDISKKLGSDDDRKRVDELRRELNAAKAGR